MNVQLGNCTDLENKVDKSKSFSVKLTTNCRMKEDCSISEPVIYVKMDSFENLSFNYAHISFLNRYYYITDIVLKNSKTIEISLKVDVLNSFKDIIRNTSTFIERSQSDYLPMINDTMLPLSSKRTNKISIIGGFDTTLKNYLVVTNGGEDS